MMIFFLCSNGVQNCIGGKNNIMRLVTRSSAGVLYLTFNQDYTCLSIADYKGMKIYSLETHKMCFSSEIGAVSICEMLFCSSLLAFVGAGEQPVLTPRKLTLMNTTTGSVIQDLSFPTSVLAVRMNKRRLVTVLERRAYVYDLETLNLMQLLETAANPKGQVALTPCSEPCVLALPSSATSGTVRFYNLAVGVDLIAEVPAHRSPLAVMEWNYDGSLLASASKKGTVIRVHALPQAQKLYTFRRGTRPAVVCSVAFSPPGVSPPFLCASSDHGTVHLFRLGEPDRNTAAAAASMIASAIPGAVSDLVDSARCFTMLRIPCSSGTPSICAVLAPRPARDSTMDEKAIWVGVVSADAVLYEYSISMKYPQGPISTLEELHYILPRPGFDSRLPTYGVVK
eukprot:jgi/Botrbrau1/19492/Bobra.0571s0001.1